MKTATRVTFASALVLSVVAPSLSYAAYFVDATRIWALQTHTEDVVSKRVRHTEGAAQTEASREGSLRAFYGTDNTSVPGASFDKDDTTPRLR